MNYVDTKRTRHPRGPRRTAAIGRMALCGLCLLVLTSFAPFPAQAATLQISPVSITLSPSTNASGLTLINPSDAPLYGQVRVFRWTQVDGDDHLVATDDLIASPPLIQIPGKSDQLVRLVKRQAAPAPVEQSYRLLVDELPGPDDKSRGGVTIRLRYSVPVFIEQPAQNHAQAVLSWHIAKATDHWILTVTNAGVQHAQISTVTVYGPSGAPYVVTKGLLGYVLAGASRAWKIELPANAAIGADSKVHASINTVPSDATLTLGSAE